MSSPSRSLYYSHRSRVHQEIENKLVLIIHATFFYKCVVVNQEITPRYAKQMRSCFKKLVFFFL